LGRSQRRSGSHAHTRDSNAHVTRYRHQLPIANKIAPPASRTLRPNGATNSNSTEAASCTDAYVSSGHGNARPNSIRQPRIPAQPGACRRHRRHKDAVVSDRSGSSTVRRGTAARGQSGISCGASVRHPPWGRPCHTELRIPTKYRGAARGVSPRLSSQPGSRASPGSAVPQPTITTAAMATSWPMNATAITVTYQSPFVTVSSSYQLPSIHRRAWAATTSVRARVCAAAPQSADTAAPASPRGATSVAAPQFPLQL